MRILLRSLTRPLIACLLGTAAVCSAASPPSALPTPDFCRSLADEVENHWRQEELPKWFPRCIDQEHGGFYPHFREDWSRGEVNDKTIVYQARMTWVSAQVALAYPEAREEYLGYTRHGLKLLADVLWDAEYGGFYWGLDENGKTTASFGDEKHAYGISFGLYGACAAYEATRDAEALDLAQRTFAWLEKHAHDSVHGGYYEALTRSGRVIGGSGPDFARPAPGRTTDQLGTLYGFKSMNSHIHLLEALTSLYRIWPDALVEARLREVWVLVRDKIAVEPGCLNLFFTPDWRAVPDHDSFGHDVETAFLLIEAAEALNQPEDARTLDVARSLVDHALAWGWDRERGGFYDKGAAFHAAWQREKIWWTQAEGLNALLLMHERFPTPDRRYFQAFLQQWDFIRKYQIDPRHGGWHESVSEEGIAEPGKPKATIWKAAYHNGRALMTVAARLRTLAAAP